MNKNILHPEVQAFIHKNQKKDISSLILKGSPFKDVSIQELAIQISALQKTEKKLPSWYKTKNILYPQNLNLEQSSSEVTAKYKASLVHGTQLVDLTGGFGVDDYYFAEKFENVTHCELNSELSKLVAQNFKEFKKDNVSFYDGNGLEYLKTLTSKVDCIYIDPARRDDYGGKVFHLNNCLPNVPDHLDLLIEKSDKILIKTSPLLDLTAGIKQLKYVSKIHIVAVNDDVKELVWELDINVRALNVEVKTVNFKTKGDQYFSSIFDDSQQDIKLSLPKEYLYEPNPAVMKSGMFKALTSKTTAQKLHVNSHLFTSNALVEFPGRIFQVIELKDYNNALLKQKFSFKKANIATRNFPLTVAELRKKFKIKDGGEVYLFFTTNLDEQKIVLVCKKVTD